MDAAGLTRSMKVHMSIKSVSAPGRASGRILCAACMLAAAQFASAQVHEVRSGDLTLRSSSVSSERIDPATAARHGIEPSPGTSVLNVVVMRGSAREPVPARVSATARSLAGIRQEIGLREVRENGRVSYLGTYDVAPREVLDLEVKATPLASPAPATPPTLVLRYRERAWAIERDNASK